jgi:hypothetical protein
MNGEQTQELIYDWLGSNLPDGVDWQNSDHVELNLAVEIKMILAFDALEYNIDNGGWAQLLWNCLGQWRVLLEIAEEGYNTIGALPQARAIREIWKLCAESELECTIALSAAGDTADGFAEFAARSYAVGPDWQELFYHNSTAYEQRLSWLQRNAARVRRAVGLYDN